MTNVKSLIKSEGPVTKMTKQVPIRHLEYTFEAHWIRFAGKRPFTPLRILDLRFGISFVIRHLAFVIQP